MRLEDQKAVVTGASRGIGKAIAIEFAREGADVAITARSSEALDETREAIEGLGRICHPMAWDVSDVSVARERLKEAQGALGGLDIVVNNAGVHHLEGAAGKEDDWDYVIDTNMKAVWFITEEAARLMIRGGGAIVNIGSDYGFRGGNSIYGVSKWGVRGMTRGLGQKWAGKNIRVNGIGPGPVATSMSNWHEGDSLERANLPLGRLTTPEEVAKVAVFLASEDASAVIGEMIVLNSANT